MFGVKEVHKVKSGAEVTDRIVGQYNIRLVEERRSEFNPSGLLVAEYSEKQMVGERDNGLEQKSELDNMRQVVSQTTGVKHDKRGSDGYGSGDKNDQN